MAVPLDEDEEFEDEDEEVDGEAVLSASLPNADADIGVVLAPGNEVAGVVVVVVAEELRPGFSVSSIQNCPE